MKVQRRVKEIVCLLFLLVTLSCAFKVGPTVLPMYTRPHSVISMQTQVPPVRLSRLNENLPLLLSWITQGDGSVNHSAFAINKTDEGWTLVAKEAIPKGATVVRVPRNLCIYSDPKANKHLLPSVIEVMEAFNPSQWRTRLAIAMLSERVRPKSFFYPYLSNLPFEVLGLPFFFNITEFELIQDPSLMQSQIERCKFLQEFTKDVLIPMSKSQQEIFSGHKPSLDSFGWAFGVATSRAIRIPEVIGDEGPVIVPLIDIASHSFDPNCEVVLDADGYELRTLFDVDVGSELAIKYGTLTNEELFSDYGFTVDANPHEDLNFKLDAPMIDMSRAIMGQCIYSSTFKVEEKGDKEQSQRSSGLVPIGRGGDRYNERWLHPWQLIWLRALGLINYSSNANFAMKISTVGGKPVIDGRCYAAFRVLYAKEEEDLEKHGYTPTTLCSIGSMMDPEIEKEVLRTLAGMVTVLLVVYGTSVDTDIFALRSGFLDLLADDRRKPGVIQSSDIVGDAQKILRAVLQVPAALSSSPSVRKFQLLEGLFDDKGNTAQHFSSSKNVSLEELIQRSQNLSLKSNEEESAEIKAVKESQMEISDPKAELSQTTGIFVDDIRSLRGKSDIGQMGYNLPINVRECLKYRVRKKRALGSIIQQLADQYSRLSKKGDDDHILRIATDEKEVRKMKIKELLDEVMGNSSDSSEKETQKNVLLSVASAVSKKYADKGSYL